MASKRTTAGSPSTSLDFVCCRILDGRLTVLRTAPSAARGKTARRSATSDSTGTLPWVAFTASGSASIDDAGARLARSVLGAVPSWSTQLGAFNGGGAHPSRAALSVAYLAVVPTDTDAPEGMAWVPVETQAGLPPRQRAMLRSALVTLRERMDVAPVAFRMLPAVFTLSDLQEVYELLLGRSLHKASFRRALQGAYLVTPTGAWRSEGRGRPAQLFRYAPRKRKRGAAAASRRPVRFELLG